MGRRYGNWPGLIMALLLVAGGVLVLLVYPDGWEHRMGALIVAAIGAFVVWHWREYIRAIRQLRR